MLEQRDLQAIAEIVDKRAEKTETTLRGEMQEMKTELRGEMQEMETRLRGEMQEMETRLHGEMQEMETRLRGEMRETETRLHGEIVDTRELLLDEMARYDQQNDKRFSRLEKDVSELKQYDHLRQLENRNDELLFKLVDGVRQDVDELKLRFA